MQVENWLRHAASDLKTITKILDDNELSNVVAFHTHQCVEKSFKAVIAASGVKVPAIHNLVRLYGTVRTHLSIDIDLKVLEAINETYIDSRYPTDVGLLPEGYLSLEKAQAFYTFADSIYKQIERVLNTARYS